MHDIILSKWGLTRASLFIPALTLLSASALVPLPLRSQVLDRPGSASPREPAKAQRPQVVAKAPASAVSLFRAHCLECHAANGRGEGLFPSIPDFTDPRWQTSQTDHQLGHAILEGQGKSMPAMKGKLSMAEVTELVVLVRAFEGGRQLILEDEEDGKPPGVDARPVATAVRPDPPRAADARPAVSHSVSLLFQRSCRVCHGADGKGDGRRAAMPEIPDFSKRTWQKRRSRTELTASIVEGRGTNMPGFGDTLSPVQVRELVEFVRAFNPAPARPSSLSAGDFDARLTQLQEEFESLRREYRSLSSAPR
jgi:mono/diheme cytochrome c family protein